MADDVTLNAMSGGDVVSTDQAGDGSHVQVVKLAYSADGSRTPIDADTDGLKVNVSNTSVTVALSGGSLPTGSNVIGAVTQSGTWNIGSITTLPSLATGSNVIGAVTQSGTWNVGLSAGTAAVGTVKMTHQPTPYKLNSAASTNATSVSATANTLLYGYYISNTNSSVRYVKFYNKASAPTVGTDTPVLVLAIPGSGAANVSFPAGVNFTTGLAFATTTGAADNDTGAVAANEVIVNLVYATY
jgi:hypothetical protein